MKKFGFHTEGLIADPCWSFRDYGKVTVKYGGAMVEVYRDRIRHLRKDGEVVELWVETDAVLADSSFAGPASYRLSEVYTSLIHMREEIESKPMKPFWTF